MGPYSRRASKHPRTPPSRNSFCLADTKSGLQTDIRGSSEETVTRPDGNDYYGSNDGEIQVTTTVEVAHHDDGRSAAGVGMGGSANTSERSLVIPPAQHQ